MLASLFAVAYLVSLLLFICKLLLDLNISILENESMISRTFIVFYMDLDFYLQTHGKPISPRLLK